MNDLTQVIAAISTPPGKGGVAVIRVSGNGAFDIAEKIFVSASGKPLSEYKPRFAIYGYIVEGDERIDDVILTKFASPNSYTSEDTVEISCHGGMLVTRTVLECLISAGCRIAEAGEFTRRAFINGKLSLTEAEAISMLLEAKSRDQIRLSSDASRSRLSERVSEIRGLLVDLMSSIYARIDYPDEDLGEFDDDEVLSRLEKIKKTSECLLNTYRTGRAINEGVSTVICGKTNVGKSSVYNLLVGEDAAIVTDVEGTTRDVLVHSVPLGRAMLRIADTAGISDRENIDAVERIGIDKSCKMIEKSELLFAIFDLSREFDEQDELVINQISLSDAPKIAILNKNDSERKFDISRLPDIFERVIYASAEQGDEELVDALRCAVEELFCDEKIVIGTDAVISSARQYAALKRCVGFVITAYDSLSLGFSQDAVSSDIEYALGAISELDGRAVSEEIVNDIFSKFCVGK